MLWSLSEGVGGVFGFASRPCQHQVINMGPAKSRYSTKYLPGYTNKQNTLNITEENTIMNLKILYSIEETNAIANYQ